MRLNELKGKVVKLKKCTKNESYPWKVKSVPVLITQVTDYLIAGTVLPHTPVDGFGKSWPYQISIHRHELQAGDVKITEVIGNEN